MPRKVLGIDEAGRGPVIGPLVIVGFLIDEEKIPLLRELGVRDSKLLSPRKREELFEKLKEIGEYFVEFIQPAQIDAGNINLLEQRVMAKIIRKSGADLVIVDAFPGLKLEGNVIAEPKADAKYEVVGAASIIAKVLRDREIEKIKEKYGDFGSGYPSDERTVAFIRELLRKYKTLPSFVRRSWGTIRKMKEREYQRSLINFY